MKKMPTTPHKNRDHHPAPYSTPMRNYPSQSGDFLSLEIGGPGDGHVRPTTSTPAKDNSGAYFYQNKQQQQTQSGGFVAGGRGGGRPNYFHGGNRNSYGRSSGGGGSFEQAGGFHQNYHQQQQYNRRSAGGRGGNGNWQGGGGGSQRFRQGGSGFGHKNNHGTDNAASYFHPTMLEDPWNELMQRFDCLGKSKINVKVLEAEAGTHSAGSDAELQEVEENMA